MSRWVWIGVLALTLGCATSAAQEAPERGGAHGKAEGHGKGHGKGHGGEHRVHPERHGHDQGDRATTHRRFDNVDFWVKRLDSPDRAEWQQAGKVAKILGIQKGQVLADVGAGTGYFNATWSLSVGPAGTVYALEVEPNLVAHMLKRAEEEGTANVVPVLTSLDRPRLPHRGVDWVVLVNTYHHIDYRKTYFGRAAEWLRPGGKVVIVDWKPGELPVGPKPDHKIAPEVVAAELEEAGLRLVASSDELAYQFVRVFEVAAR